MRHYFGVRKMKKILLLGGSAQQVIVIETAKRLGYYTVLCDYLTDNPGQNYADVFYPVSTTEKETVLHIAQKEKVDGVLAYASDPAAPTAAYVAEKMKLPTNSYESVETLCNKDRFREFLHRNDFNAPRSCSFENYDDIEMKIKEFNLPVIIKPVDSSGSKGVTVLEELTHLDDAVETAFSFSRAHRIIVEEFIEKKHAYLIGGDVFVDHGKIILWGLLNCHRDNSVNPLVPVGKSYPVILGKEDMENVKNTLQSIVDKLQIKSCGMNVELIVDKSGKVWPIDIGPRNGGNMIPDLLGMIFGVDMVEMALRAAMGEKIDVKPKEGIPFYATHNLHSAIDGIYERIEYSDEIEKYIVKKVEYKKAGDRIEYFDNAAKALGIVFMKFESNEEMLEILEQINSYIKVYVRSEENELWTG